MVVAAGRVDLLAARAVFLSQSRSSAAVSLSARRCIHAFSFALLASVRSASAFAVNSNCDQANGGLRRVAQRQDGK